MKRLILSFLMFTIIAIIAGVTGCSDRSVSPIAPGTTSDVSLSKVLPDHSHAYGKSLAEWSAEWWKWGMSLPLAGHPFIDDPSFKVTTGQSGQVWFLGAPSGTVTRNCTIPDGKALFIGVICGEASDLEGLGTTEAEQRVTAKFYADHIRNPFCSVDNVPVKHIGNYLVMSPQFKFTAPTPWIYGTTGGKGKSVSDGIFLMLTPFSHGRHTLHYGGSFHFDIGEIGNTEPVDIPFDMTYNLKVQGEHQE